MILASLKESSELSIKYYDFMEEFSAKLDILAKTDYSSDFENVLVSALSASSSIVHIISAA